MPDSSLDKLPIFGTGWRPDPPTKDDHHLALDRVRKLVKKTKLHVARRRPLPAKVDLRPFCTPVQYQGTYNTCTAHVVTSMLAQLENTARGSYVIGSRLFLFQVTKRLLGETGNPALYFRQTFGAIILCGVPPERFFPYLDTTRDDDPRIDAEPDAFCYAVADDYGTGDYYRLDATGVEPEDILRDTKAHLARKIPVSLGFPLFMSSLLQAKTTGLLPLPAPDEQSAGSHAALLVGYDDDLEITNSDGGPTSKGAFLLQNSWTDTWGQEGFGWIPYDYVLQGRTGDLWTMLTPKWIDTDQFKIDVS